MNAIVWAIALAIVILVVMYAAAVYYNETTIDYYNFKDKTFGEMVTNYGYTSVFNIEKREGRNQIKTLVINNQKIMLSKKDNSKELFENLNGDLNLEEMEFLENEYSPYNPYPTAMNNTIESFEDIQFLFPNITSLIVYNYNLPNADKQGSQYSALGKNEVPNYCEILRMRFLQS